MSEAADIRFHQEVRQRLIASQTATPQASRLDHAVEDAVSALGRVNYHMIWHEQEPSEFTVRRIEAVCSRLLQAAQAYRMSITSAGEK